VKGRFIAGTSLLANPRLSANKKTVRSILTLLLIAAWFGLSNHCAIALALPPQESAPESEAGSCPMHSAPAKKKPAAKAPCCKDVRALVAKCATANPPTIRLINSHDYAMQMVARPERAAREIAGLDTGPPLNFSFAESVLQESMFSHAPPVS
jgi:hypothetical protein